MDDFTIDQISWHAKLDNSPEFQLRLRRRFVTICGFLDSHGLLKNKLDLAPIDKGEDFAIHSSALTPEGLEFMRKAYSRWLKSLDRGSDPGDFKFLDRELTKLKQGK